MQQNLKRIALGKKLIFHKILILALLFGFQLSAQHNHDHGGHQHHGHNHDHGSHDHHGHHHNHDHHGHDHHGHKHAHDHSKHDHGAHDKGHGSKGYATDCGSPGHVHEHHGYDPAATAIHHISDANVYTILDFVRIPLPCIIYNKDRGFEFFSSGKFHAGHHDNGHHGYKDYVLYEGNVHRIDCPNFKGSDAFEVEGFDHVTVKNDEGKDVDKKYAIINGKAYLLEAKTIWDAGILGGGPSSFYDLSPTKNVISMFLVALVLFLIFRRVAKAYATNTGSAPKGIQSLMEVMFQFVRDEVAIPFIGKKKHHKYLPLLMSIFFFILGLNLWGQVPFLGSTNVTGSLTVTMILAIIVFIVVNINGNKDYWKHIFWMPGVPTFVKPLLAAVEGLGLFIKPLTLMLRLAGNITAGHIAILSFIGLIFIFGNAGQSLAGSSIGTALAVPLTLFMMAIELIVAFIQAFVFTLLTASYIGAATEEHHH